MHSLALCNCDKDDGVWREDGGLMTDKTKLSVKRNSSILGIEGCCHTRHGVNVF